MSPACSVVQLILPLPFLLFLIVLLLVFISSSLPVSAQYSWLGYCYYVTQADLELMKSSCFSFPSIRIIFPCCLIIIITHWEFNIIVAIYSSVMQFSQSFLPHKDLYISLNFDMQIFCLGA